MVCHECSAFIEAWAQYSSVIPCVASDTGDIDAPDAIGTKRYRDCFITPLAGKQWAVSNDSGNVLFRAASLEGAEARIDRLGNCIEG